MGETPKRRAHHKSRRGCNTCKGRRVKCDEGRPVCLNCKRKDLSCTYPASVLASRTHIIRPLAAKTAVRPQSVSQAVHETQPKAFDIEDLQLLSRFHTQVCQSLDEDDLQPLQWSFHAKSAAFQEPVVLHAALAVAALYTNRDCLPRSTPRAVHHYTTALGLMVQTLPDVPEESVRSTFLAGVLLCTYNFANGPQPGQFLAFSDGSEAELILLVKGVRTMLLSSPATIGSMLPTIDPITDLIPRPQDLMEAECALGKLHAYVRGLMKECSASNDYLRSIDALKETFREALYQRGSCGTVLSHNVMKWLWFLAPDFLRSLQDGDAVALLILAHYTVLFSELKHLWWFEGWPVHVLDGIRTRMVERHVHMLEWPTTKIQCIRNSSRSASQVVR